MADKCTWTRSPAVVVVALVGSLVLAGCGSGSGLTAASYSTDREFTGLDGLPPDWEDLPDDDLAEKLLDHPELQDNDDVMDDLRHRLDATGPDAANDDAHDVTDGDTEAAGRAALIGIYGQYAQEKNAEGEDTSIPPDAAQYLHDFVHDVYGSPGDGRLESVVDMQKVLQEGDGSDWTHGLLANSVLVASDARLDPANGSGNSKPVLGGSTVPPVVVDALHDSPEPHKRFSSGASLAGGDGFQALAGLLADSDAHAGAGLSQQLTDTTADLIADIQDLRKLQNDPDASDLHTPAMAQMINVAARNRAANVSFLDAAAHDHGQAAQRLADLYTFDWDDGTWMHTLFNIGEPHGNAVAGYTDWIGDAHHSGSAGQRKRANTAAAHVFNAVTSTSTNVNDGHTVIEAMMTDAGADADIPQPIGNENPAITQSLAQTASTYFDDLAAEPTVSHHTAEAENRDGIDVPRARRKRLFAMIESDETAADDVRAMVRAYRQSQLDAAVRERSGSEEDAYAKLRKAAEETERLTNLVAAGRYTADAIMAEVRGKTLPDKEDYDNDRWNKPDAETRELFEALKRNEDDLTASAETLYKHMHDDGEEYPDLEQQDRQRLIYSLVDDLFDAYTSGQNNAPTFDELTHDSVHTFFSGGST